jgi:Sugar (and other) transporter
MGIGGEYAAINSAIDEMIPAKYRGRVDLAVNGTYWAGAILGTIVTLFLLNHVVAAWGWRIAYLVGPVLALVIIFVRRHLPESPRWQIMHGRQEAAEASIAEIEDDVSATRGELPPVDESKELEIRPVERFGYLKLLELRRAPDHYRVPVQERCAERDDPDDLLGGRVLLRVSGRQRRLPDRERGLGSPRKASRWRMSRRRSRSSRNRRRPSSALASTVRASTPRHRNREELELHPVVERLIGRVLLSEVRGLRALHRQVGRRAQRAER